MKTARCSAAEGKTPLNIKNNRTLINGLLNRGRPIKLEDILKMHIHVMNFSDDGVHQTSNGESNGDLSHISGHLREVQSAAGLTLKTAPFEQIRPMMLSLLKWINSQEKKAPKKRAEEIAAEVFLRLIIIHPFCDGNGRIARLLLNTLLLRYGRPAIDLKLINWDRGPYDHAPEDVKYLAFLIREAQAGRSMKGYRRYSGKQLPENISIMTMLESPVVEAGDFLDWIDNLHYLLASPLSLILSVYEKTSLSSEQFHEFLRILNIGAARTLYPLVQQQCQEVINHFAKLEPLYCFPLSD